MGKNKSEGARCRRHGRQPGGAGVCPLCLRERLSHLSSASLPSFVVARGDAAAESSCCSDDEEEYSTGYSSSTEGSSGASSASGSGSPWAASAARFNFHKEMMVAGRGRVSLLMRHERVLLDEEEVAEVVRRRERRATSFWAKLLRATTRGAGGGKDGCSVAHAKSTLDQGRSAVAKWILF